MKLWLIAAAFLSIFATGAEARPHAGSLDPGCNVIFPCDVPYGGRQMASGARLFARHASRVAEPQIVDHPSGCPRSLFCGCGAAVRVFGTPRRDLWAAAAWYRFPRAMPAPGMAAVRHHHVMVLESSAGDGEWIVYDANSGGHATRIHARSLAGYTIVNPRG